MQDLEQNAIRKNFESKCLVLVVSAGTLSLVQLEFSGVLRNRMIFLAFI